MFGPCINNGGNGGLYFRVVRFVQLFENAWSHAPSDAFFNADHDELIKIYIFSKKLGPPPTFVVKLEHGRQKNLNVKIVTNGF